MNIPAIVGTLVVEEIAKAIWRRATSDKRVEGSMYPFRLPRETQQQKPPLTPNSGTIQVFQQRSAPEVKSWENKFSKILGKSYVERPESPYSLNMHIAMRELQEIATNNILRELGYF